MRLVAISFFFFSSRRRHTRCSRDWSSDVCSSDLHRKEHSIEFQAVFLRYLFAGRREISIVPVLASFAHEALAQGRRGGDKAKIPSFFAAPGGTPPASGRPVGPIPRAQPAPLGCRLRPPP